MVFILFIFSVVVVVVGLGGRGYVLCSLMKMHFAFDHWVRNITVNFIFTLYPESNVYTDDFIRFHSR